MERLWDGDIRHIGDLLRYNRKSRRLTQAEIAKAIGVTSATISRLERGYEKNMGGKTVSKYIAVLESEVSRHPRLTADQAQMLRELYVSFKERRAREELLSTVDFRSLRRRQSPGLGRLIAQLETSEEPALIFDPLWCVHAFNGAVLRLFGINPDNPNLHSWEAWHSLGSKFPVSSPVRQAHLNADTYFPITVVEFFQNPYTRPFLFTTQMRYLVYRLHQLSEQNQAHFTPWWLNAITFSQEFTGESLARQIMSPRRASAVLWTQAAYRDSVPIAEGYDGAFILGCWEPLDDVAARTFADISRMPGSREVYYAADYDTSLDFHPNTWPEVRLSLASAASRVLTSP